ncbi:MAG: hypothetical protein KDI33_11420 [Halioglobus sp.]|nr:hypothetical protein [Halioglobus sp.]
MACSSSSSIPLGPWTIGIETLSTALSLFAAFYFFDKWKEDTENLMDLADKYTAIGDEYCQKADDFRANEIRLLQYAKDYPDTAPDQHYARTACVAIAAEAQATLQRAYNAMPADAVGSRCLIRQEVARQMIRAGVAATTDATIRQRLLDDRYKAAKVKAMTDVLGTLPNIATAFQLVAETVSNSMMANAEAFGGFAYGAARGAGTLWQRFNQPSSTQYAPALNQYGPATPVTVGGFF